MMSMKFRNGDYSFKILCDECRQPFDSSEMKFRQLNFHIGHSIAVCLCKECEKKSAKALASSLTTLQKPFRCVVRMELTAVIEGSDDETVHKSKD